jgi:hypothetical protein
MEERSFCFSYIVGNRASIRRLHTRRPTASLGKAQTARLDRLFRRHCTCSIGSIADLKAFRSE